MIERPRIHFTPENHWINDPNGLVYAEGLYHLFFQYNPYGTDHAFMSWGHAVSSDLIHWEDRSTAILCDEEEQIFSGSAVVDAGNTAGFGPDGSSPLVAIYTSHYSDASPFPKTQAQSLAYSLDGGETWTKHQGNPVLNRGSSDFRDPKVFRYAGPAGEHWVMVAVEAVDRKVVLYRSEDLKDWTFLSEFTSIQPVGEIWECPDLFPLAVDGDPENLKWVLVISFNQEEGHGGSKGIFFIGDFDGISFTPAGAPGSAQPEWEWLDHGRDYYAAVSFNDAPEGRRIMIGWMNNWEYARVLPTEPWRGSMALPRELSLHDDGAGRLALRQRVARDLPENGPGPEATGVDLSGESRTVLLPLQEGAGLLSLRIAAGTATEFGFILKGRGDDETVLGYDVERQEVFLDRTRSGASGFSPLFASRESARTALDGNVLDLSVYLDAGSVEVFAQDGRVTITDQVFPLNGLTALLGYARGGTARVLSAVLTPLASTPVARAVSPRGL